MEEKGKSETDPGCHAGMGKRGIRQKYDMNKKIRAIMTDGDAHTEDCMAGQQIKDMTKGPPGRLLMIFAIPLMLGNICQQTVYDGRYHCRRTGRRSPGSGSSGRGGMDHVDGSGSLYGSYAGFSILISQHYGAKKWDLLKRTVAPQLYPDSGDCGSAAHGKPDIRALDIDFSEYAGQHYRMSLLYLRIVFCGIPVVAAYNVFAAVLRALGNSPHAADRHGYRGLY